MGCWLGLLTSLVSTISKNSSYSDSTYFAIERGSRARFAWGQYWSGDIKQNMTAIALLIYAAYFILWKSFKDEKIQARVSGVFTIFAYVAMIPLIFVIPRLYDSLHPGNGGNPALGGEDLDSTMRMVFYPGIIAFTLLGFWLSNIYYRIKQLDDKMKQ